ncbi:MAG: PEP-utilizing enzyme [archaeon]
MKWKKLLTRENAIFMDVMKMQSSAKKYLDLGIDYTIKDFKVVNAKNYVSERYNELFERVKEKIEHDPDFLMNTAERCYKDIEIFFQVWVMINKKDVKKLRDEELKKLFKEYLNTLYKLMAYLHLPIAIDKYLSLKLEKYGNQRLDLITPEKRSSVKEEKIELLKILLNKTEDKLDEHLRKWAWLGDHFFKGNFWTKQELLQRVEELKKKDIKKELDSLLDEENKAKGKSDNIIKELGLSGKDLNIVKAAKEYTFLRIHRLDALFKSEYLVKNLLDEIAKRMQITYDDFTYLLPEEVLEFFKTKNINKQAIEARKKNYALVMVDKKIEVYIGEDVKDYKEKEEISEGKIIKGQTASPGKVVGIVKIIMNKADFGKINTGDILVTTMTTPDFVPIMEKAVAIVTDEGGITCHAAIISRELKIPCIIGTRIATKVLKDGDKVEVDADHSIVKLIKD